MQKEEQMTRETGSEKIQDGSKSTQRESPATKNKDGVYERDFTRDELISSALVAITFFVGASTALSYLMLEVINYTYSAVGATNNYLWIGILFLLNSVVVLLIRDAVLPYVMKKEFSIYKDIKQEYFEK